jgi:type IV pilus assembly protein PilB
MERDPGHPLDHLGYQSEVVALQATAAARGLQYVDLAHFPVDREAAHLLPPLLAQRHNVLPIRKQHELLTVATADPTNRFAEDDIRQATGCRVQWAVAVPEAIRQAIAQQYSDPDTP